jgi:hypothetical protein
LRDILVSLGTGYSSDYEGEADQDRVIPKTLKSLGQMGLVAKLATLRLVQQNTSHSEKMWTDFRQSLADDPDLLTKCHRVNVPYGRGQTLCKMDEVSNMDAMQAEASSFLHQMSKSLSPSVQEQTARQLDTIAHQLLASLFYFQCHDAYDLNQYKYHCRGLLYCRLPSSCLPQMKSLINNGKPRFRVYEEGDIEGGEVLFGRNGWDYNNFSISATFDVSSCARKGVEVQVTFGGWKGAWEDISGFPRRIKRRARK